MIYILKKNGLELNRDYTFKSFGNSTKRAEAMSRGEAWGAMMNLPDDEIQKRGFKVLACSEDHVPHYARGLGATRREWADANEELLVLFIRAMVRATDWVMDGKNREETIKPTRSQPCGFYRLSQAFSPPLLLKPVSYDKK